MKWKFFVFSAGFLLNLVLFLHDQEVSAGLEKLAGMRLAHARALDADPDLRLVSMHSPYMRNER